MTNKNNISDLSLMVRVLLKHAFLFLFVMSVSACAIFGKRDYDQQLKSPCVSANGGPCERYNVNDWWLKDGSEQPYLIKAVV